MCSDLQLLPPLGGSEGTWDVRASLTVTPWSPCSATRDPATSVPAPGAHQPPQTPEGEKSPESLGLPQSQR